LATNSEEVGQNVDHIDRLELAGDTGRQTFVGELVEHVEHPVLASIVSAILDEVIGPDMICKIWYLISRTVSDDDPHWVTLMIARSALSPSSRAFGAPRCGIELDCSARPSKSGDRVANALTAMLR
jgi:hypothetical protein